MSLSAKDLIQAVEYAAHSPFVEKIRGVPESENLYVAKGICELSATLGTVRKEHENIIEIFAAAECEPQPCEQVLTEYIRSETEKMDAAYKAAEEAWNATKIDEAYVEKCRQKIADEKRWFEDYKNRMEAEKREAEKRETEKREAEKRGFGRLRSLFGKETQTTAKTIETTETDFDEKVKQYEKNIFLRRIGPFNEGIERGYELGSAFDLDLQKRKMEFQLPKKHRQMELDLIKEMISNHFQGSVALVQKALDNFEALSSWATNFVRDQVQKEHNEEMEALERRRLYEQRKAAAAQEEAAREQSDLLKKQADAAQVQAEAAKRQARDTEEIRRRMERGQ